MSASYRNPCTPPSPSAGASVEVGRQPGTHKSTFHAPGAGGGHAEHKGLPRRLWPSTMCFDNCRQPCSFRETRHKAPRRQSSCLINMPYHSVDPAWGFLPNPNGGKRGQLDHPCPTSRHGEFLYLGDRDPLLVARRCFSTKDTSALPCSQPWAPLKSQAKCCAWTVPAPWPP